MTDLFQQTSGVQFHDTVQAVKAARLCYPVQAQALRATAATLEEFRKFPFANNDATIAILARELPQYIPAAAGVTVTCEDDKVSWWAAHRDTISFLPVIVKKPLLIQPSSATADGVFSKTVLYKIILKLSSMRLR